jgi:lipoprotein-anchoring transpeptidase ErfK/SrfK
VEESAGVPAVALPLVGRAATAQTKPAPAGEASVNRTGASAPPVLPPPTVSPATTSIPPTHTNAESAAATPAHPGPSVQELEFLDHQGGGPVYDGVGNPLEWTVHVYKSRHLLDVYFKGHLYRSYHAVFGRSPFSGAKEWEGDMRTPEGNYLIISKHPSARFEWFLRLNYPNAADEERFEQGRATHLISASIREGGQIGIHGTDAPALNVADVNWTTGCISVGNDEINEMARLLPVGTLVVIAP